MQNFWDFLWRHFSPPNFLLVREVEQMAALQRNAANCRATYAEEQQAVSTTGTALRGSLSLSRKKMEDAEATYRLALQRWENRASRQKLG